MGIYFEKMLPRAPEREEFEKGKVMRCKIPLGLLPPQRDDKGRLKSRPELEKVRIKGRDQYVISGTAEIQKENAQDILILRDSNDIPIMIKPEKNFPDEITLFKHHVVNNRHEIYPIRFRSDLPSKW